MSTRIARIRVRRIGALIATLAVAVGVAATVGPGPAAEAEPSQAGTRICERYGSTRVQGGRYIVQNNQWGADVGQCVDVTATGFTVTGASHAQGTNGAPGSFPSIFRGCHYGNCTTDSGLPAPYTSLGSLPSSARVTTPSTGSWNVAYDLWLDPTPRTGGQNTGAEIMIWVDRNGPPQPVGSHVGTVTLAGATWDVWYGNIGWNVVSYVRQQGSHTFDGDLRGFIDDAASRGHVQTSWYLTSVQFGFEPWVGGPGLAVTSFSVDTGTGTGGPGTTTTTAPTSTTSTSTTSTTVPSGGGCRATAQVDRWNGGFVTNVTVENRGSEAINGWTARFRLPGDAFVLAAWNAVAAQSGRQVTATNAAYNGSIPPGRSVTFGFIGAADTGDAVPTGLTLNGTACTGG
jgi:hypothetical protein